MTDRKITPTLRTLIEFIECNPNKVYKLIYKDTSFLAYYDTEYDSDNGLEEDDPQYEEYYCVLFKKVNDGTLFEVNYHNIPTTVMCGDTHVI